MRDKQNLRKWREKYKEWERPATVEYQAEWYLRNKKRLSGSAKERYISGGNVVARKRQLQKYGITDKQYEAVLESQCGRCAICGVSNEVFKKALHVDHNHLTGKIRELLCGRCNSGIGFFKENIFNLFEAARYLEVHSCGS